MRSQVELAGGQAALSGLVVGAVEDWERLACAAGCGYLVASSWGLAPGYCRVALPDLKAKRPPGGAAGGGGGK